FSNKMFFTRKRSKRWSTLDICKFRAETRQQLQDSYWDHAGNQTVCQSVMDTLPTLHVSKKADEAWILAFVESVREVYSHASGNLPELLFTDAQREEERKRYWVELSKMLSKVMLRITSLPDAHHPFSPVGRMACMMSYASLYSVYKTVAIECNNMTTIHSAAKSLNELEQSEFSSVSDTEKNQLKMMYENIDLIHMLRLELPKKYDLLPPPRRRSSADREAAERREETPLSAHLRDFPKKFIEEQQKEEEKKEVEEITVQPLPPVIIVEEPVVSDSPSPPESPRMRYSSRYTTLEDYADEISAEAVASALQTFVEQRKHVVLEPIVFVPPVLPPRIEATSDSNEEVLQLTPFDPASCFKQEDKIDRYGRRSLFDVAPLPVIGKRKSIAPLINRQQSTPSDGISRPAESILKSAEEFSNQPEPASEVMLSPTFNQKVESKIIAAVLGEKPVSPMFPPPMFALDDFIMERM
ncbi:hypothetical protein PFISCL1PPCAC_9767, partial [Pristionchus fissidentatus]